MQVGCLNQSAYEQLCKIKEFSSPLSELLLLKQYDVLEGLEGVNRLDSNARFSGNMSLLLRYWVCNLANTHLFNKEGKALAFCLKYASVRCIFQARRYFWDAALKKSVLTAALSLLEKLNKEAEGVEQMLKTVTKFQAHGKAVSKLISLKVDLEDQAMTDFLNEVCVFISDRIASYEKMIMQSKDERVKRSCFNIQLCNCYYRAYLLEQDWLVHLRGAPGVEKLYIAKLAKQKGFAYLMNLMEDVPISQIQAELEKFSSLYICRNSDIY